MENNGVKTLPCDKSHHDNGSMYQNVSTTTDRSPSPPPSPPSTERSSSPPPSPPSPPSLDRPSSPQSSSSSSNIEEEDIFPLNIRKTTGNDSDSVDDGIPKSILSTPSRKRPQRTVSFNLPTSPQGSKLLVSKKTGNTSNEMTIASSSQSVRTTKHKFSTETNFPPTYFDYPIFLVSLTIFCASVHLCKYQRKLLQARNTFKDKCSTCLRPLHLDCSRRSLTDYSKHICLRCHRKLMS